MLGEIPRITAYSAETVATGKGAVSAVIQFCVSNPSRKIMAFGEIERGGEGI